MNQREYRNKVSFGKQREFITIAKLLELKFDVYTPLVDDQGIDCIIRRGDNDYVELQIKARSKICQPKDAGMFSAMKIPEPRKNYFFIFYSEQAEQDGKQGIYWIFPSLKLVNEASKNEKGTDAGTYNINLTRQKKGKVYPSEKYSEYINNFELLTTSPL